jgi:uncharacterized protein (TIGR03437 family)
MEQQVTLTIQTSPYASLPGQAVRITAFVAPVMSVPDPAGTIQLLDGTTDLGTFPVALGQVSTAVTFYSAGARTLNAIYSGDFNYCPAFAWYGQAVDRLTPSVTLSGSAPAAVFGEPLIFTAQVTPAPPNGVAPPTGPVEIREGTAILGTASVTGGRASLTLSTLAAGTHQITATLTGDPDWYSVRSAPVTQQINPAATTTVLTAVSTASRVTLTAAVTAAAPSAAVPSGAVRFVDSTTDAVLGTGTLPSASLSIPLAQIAARPITAVYPGSSNFAASASGAIGIPGIINATGASSPNFTADEIVSIFGFNLSGSATPLLGTPPLPTLLGGTSVTFTDSTGAARQAGLYLVSAQQINCLIPTATAAGPATVTVSGSSSIPIHINVAPVAPGLFDPGTQILRSKVDGSQTVEAVTSTTPVVLGQDTVYLLLYGTGIRNRSSLADVTVTIGTLKLPAAYAGLQAESPGLDQVNVLLPATLQGAGKVNVTLTVDGQLSNPVSLTFQ